MIIDVVVSFIYLDLSVMVMLVDLYGILKKCGICFILVGCKCSLCYWCDFIGINIVEGGIVLCVDMYLVIKLSGCYLSVMEEGYVFVV